MAADLRRIPRPIDTRNHLSDQIAWLAWAMILAVAVAFMFVLYLDHRMDDMQRRVTCLETEQECR